jgi:hypothetical protein
VRLRVWLIVLLCVVPAESQKLSAAAITPAFQIPQPMLHRMVRHSGRIFAGTVINIQRLDGPGFPITRVTFRIDEAIRGVRKGQTVQISEWGGLWQTGERYRIGERILLFLYPPSKLGLTSPVAGATGRWSIQGGVGHPGAAQIQRSELKRVAAALRRVALE